LEEGFPLPSISSFSFHRLLLLGAIKLQVEGFQGFQQVQEEQELLQR
jgi:hypothetical protein